MIQDQTIPIDFGQGVDTKSDPKHVVQGKLLRLENAVFNQAKQIAKRNGYGQITSAILGGGNITSPKLMATFQNELVCADSALGQFFSYSTDRAAWVPKGNYLPVQVSKTIVSRYYGGSSHLGVTGAALGNIALFTRTAAIAASTLSGQATVIDLSTGTVLVSDYTLPNSTTSSIPPVCVLVGGTTLGVVYANASGNPTLVTLNLASGSASFNAPVVLNTDVVTCPGMAAVGTSSGAAMVYQTATNTTVITFNASGTVSHTANSVLVGSGSNTHISLEPVSNNLWAYWSDGVTLKYAVYSSTLSTVLAAATITTTSFAQGLGRFVSAQGATGTQTLLFSGYNYNLPDQLNTTNQVQVQSNGTVGAVTLFAHNTQVYSQVFTINGAQYVTCLYISANQGTYFVLKVSDASVLSKMMAGTADHAGQYISQPIQVSASKVILPVGDGYTLVTTGNTAIPLTASSYLTLDFGSTETYQSLEADSNLILNGGQVCAYDGKAVTELGFHLSPYIVSATNTVGGSMATGTYQYYATYRFTDNQGNIYESAPSVALSYVNSVASSSATVVVSTLTMTAKRGSGGFCQIFLYRTTANGTLPKLIAKATNSTSVNTVTFVDGHADSDLTGATPIYTTGNPGDVLANDAPPAAVAMALHNNRVWIIPSELPNQVWYSKSLNPTAGVNFSGQLLINVDAVGGNCTALAPMDDKIVIFEEHQPVVVAGDGAGDTGQGATLSLPQPIPADTGCIQSKGVITFPGGVICKTPKGIYLLDRKLGFTYFGIEVEGFNSQRITAVTMSGDRNQIRFLTDSGLSLVYDYISDQWSTFTNHQGYSACVWNGRYVYARTDGKIFQENPGSYLDGTTPFAFLAQTSWLALGGVQGFQRVRRLAMLGTFANGASSSHGVSVQAAYDFSPTFQAAVPFLPGAASASGVLSYRERLPIQKCESLTLLIQEIVTGDALETVSFSNLSLEAGVKSGLNRQSAARTVG